MPIRAVPVEVPGMEAAIAEKAGTAIVEKVVEIQVPLADVEIPVKAAHRAKDPKTAPAPARRVMPIKDQTRALEGTPEEMLQAMLSPPMIRRG
jgi:tetrahydromethanopterin S-methyltransferase subunit B